MRLLVTGGNGFIGGSVARAFAKAGWAVWSLSRRQPEPAPPGVRPLRLVWGAGGWARFAPALAASRPVLVLHAIGTSSVSASFANPRACLDANTETYRDLLEAVRRTAPGARVAMCSSASVYGNPVRQPMGEGDPRVPVSPYGEAKAAAEDLGLAYARRYGLRTVSLRIFSLYGEGQRNLLVWELVQQALQGKFPLTLRGTGEERRDYLHVSDLARALDAIRRFGPCRGEPYNVASGRSLAVREVALALARHWGRTDSVHCRGEAQPGAAPLWEADIARLTALAFRPAVTLEAGLERVIAWARAAAAPCGHAEGMV